MKTRFSIYLQKEIELFFYPLTRSWTVLLLFEKALIYPPEKSSQATGEISAEAWDPIFEEEEFFSLYGLGGTCVSGTSGGTVFREDGAPQGRISHSCQA